MVSDGGLKIARLVGQDSPAEGDGWREAGELARELVGSPRGGQLATRSARHVLTDLCDTIDAAGGVLLRGGSYLPVGDPEWVDLGDVYAAACSVLGRAPYLAKDDEEEVDRW